MNVIIHIVKSIAIAQVIVIIFLVILCYVMKYIYYIKQKKKLRVSERIQQDIKSLLNKNIKLTDPLLDIFQKHTFNVLSILLTLQTKKNTFLNWDKTLQILTDKVLKPVARKYATSHHWFKRYLATQFFIFGFNKKDHPLIKKLITDEYLLISLNAAKLVTKYPTYDLLKVLIKTFAEGRRAQQRTEAVLLTEYKQNFTPMVWKILEKTKNPYSRAFCYRLLQQLVPAKEVNNATKEDLLSNNIELKLAVLHYLSSVKNKEANDLIMQNSENNNWEIRAAAVKILGIRKDIHALHILNKSLKDKVWWVRINAANALAMLGEKGINILKKQKPQIDLFAYEVAQSILKTPVSKRQHRAN